MMVSVLCSTTASSVPWQLQALCHGEEDEERRCAWHATPGVMSWASSLNMADAQAHAPIVIPTAMHSNADCPRCSVPFRQASLILQTQSCKALVRLPGRTRICTGVIACSLIFDLAKGTEPMSQALTSRSVLLIKSNISRQ